MNFSLFIQQHILEQFEEKNALELYIPTWVNLRKRIKVRQAFVFYLLDKLQNLEKFNIILFSDISYIVKLIFLKVSANL